MRGAVALLVVLAAAVGCGAGQSSPGSTSQTAETDLRITFWEAGREQKAAPTRWTLRCDPDAGTLPRRAAACDRLERLARPFAPTPKNMACADVYGGPQEARITGVHDGRRVWVALSARNGCEISRWNGLKFLLGGIGAGAGAPA
jgi:hypothetical protein